jgi:hypothetical protein
MELPNYSNGNGNGNGKPKFPPGQDVIKAEQAKNRGAIEKAMGKAKPPLPFEPRCRVCTSPYRKFIESLLIKGSNYVWISENVPGEEGRPIDRRSISNHAKKHMAYQDAAIRAILEEEARLAGQNYEEGVRGAITHRSVLEVALRKAYEDIVNGVTTVEPRDLISIINAVQKMDEQAEAVAVNQLRAQVQAFIEAIKAETDPDTWGRIFARFQRTMAEEGLGTAELPSGPVTDATVVGD